MAQVANHPINERRAEIWPFLSIWGPFPACPQNISRTTLESTLGPLIVGKSHADSWKLPYYSFPELNARS